MSGRARWALALARLHACIERFEALEQEAHRRAESLGPIFKELLAALELKLEGVGERIPALCEVAPLRAEILWHELQPLLEALEDGLGDLHRLLAALPAEPPADPDALESLYDELAHRERWLLVRLRHAVGEAVSEGDYRCCACGAYGRPGPGSMLAPCVRCGGRCFHRVSGLG